MSDATPFRCTIATPGVEVVTARAGNGTFVTTINGGRLDGERFTSHHDPDAEHDRACLLARMTAWPLRRRRRRPRVPG